MPRSNPNVANWVWRRTPRAMNTADHTAIIPNSVHRTGSRFFSHRSRGS
jgi:hypothetical protein